MASNLATQTDNHTPTPTDGWIDTSEILRRIVESTSAIDTPTLEQTCTINRTINHPRTPEELKSRVKELRRAGQAGDLIAGLIQKQSLSIVVGESGLGKSPLLYQAAICVASGRAFVQNPVSMGRVLWVDCENPLAGVDRLVDTLTGFLGLNKPPRNLRLWNFNDAGHETIGDLIRDVKPCWVIIDPVRGMFPDIDTKNEITYSRYAEFKNLMAEFNCAITLAHHPRKKRDDVALDSLETTENVIEWFTAASGSRAMVTNADTRIGIDRAKTSGADLVLRGYERLNGEFPAIMITKIHDESGEPRGFRKLSGLDSISNPDHRGLYEKLPPRGRFKDAVIAYGKTDNPTNLALKALIAAGVLKKDGGWYVKIGPGVGE